MVYALRKKHHLDYKQDVCTWVDTHLSDHALRSTRPLPTDALTEAGLFHLGNAFQNVVTHPDSPFFCATSSDAALIRHSLNTHSALITAIATELQSLPTGLALYPLETLEEFVRWNAGLPEARAVF